MAIEQLLGQVPKSLFMAEYYLRLPFALPQCARGLVNLGSWETVQAILSQPDPDVLVVRQGLRWESNHPPSYEQARDLHASGYTLLVRHAERHDPRLAQLAQGFYEDFQAPVDIHIYCTPADQHGFGWHYDAEDVFIVQTQGNKEYSLRKNTVNPWPLVETIPPDMAYEREIMPLMKCTLLAGDWLYIPGGYWHMAQAAEPSISLAIGVMSTPAVDVYDFLRPHLLCSLLWRQRLPTVGKACTLSDPELFERYRCLFAELGDDLARLMRDEAFVRSFLASNGH